MTNYRFEEHYHDHLQLEVFKFGWGIQPLVLKNNSPSRRRDMLLLLLVEPDYSLSAHPP